MFDPLPLPERLFVRARLFSAPLEQMAARAPAGRIADVGCGHGALTALLAKDRPDREVVGIDPDPRKIAWAKEGPGRLLNVSLREGTLQMLAAEQAGAFDAVVVADVLYLLPIDAWPVFLRDCSRLLKPGGTLLLKEAEADGSWKHRKALLQERVMVELLGRTRSSGAINLLSREGLARLLREAGFTLDEVVPLGRGYTTPHVLFVARRG